MDYLYESILATLVYYDILDFPLTLHEICKYLINPKRFYSSRSDLETSLRSDLGIGVKNVKSLVFDIKLADIAVELDSMVKVGAIGSKNGFYFLPGKDTLYELRIEREKIAAQKWKKFLKIAKWFQVVPYLRAVLASGSLAIDNTGHGSDFDVLTVAKSGRLYVCRIFLSLMASLFGARRTRYEQSAPDKFCFNHFITDGDLGIKYESLYNAQTYVNLKPVLANKEIFGRFFTENIWLNKYVYNFRPAEEFVLRTVSSSPFLLAIARIGEFILDSPVGDVMEDWVKKYQQKRIKNNPATYESGGRVVFNDNELEFHPRSFEAFAIDKYNKGLRRFGIIPYIEEKDSGLNV